MTRDARQFWVFTGVFLVLYIASKALDQAKNIQDWILVLGILYAAYAASKTR